MERADTLLLPNEKLCVQQGVNPTRVGLQAKGDVACVGVLGLPCLCKGFSLSPNNSYSNSGHSAVVPIELSALSSHQPCSFFLLCSRLHLNKKTPDKQPYSKLAGVSLLKPLKGVDPNLVNNLETFFELDYPKVRGLCHGLSVFPGSTHPSVSHYVC